MSNRHFINPFDDYSGNDNCQINESQIKTLIKKYVSSIITHTNPEVNDDRRGDLYVGDAGIAYMFWKLETSQILKDEISALSYAKHYIQNAKNNAKHYSKRADERCAFLCGNAGIYAVSTIISKLSGNVEEYENDLKRFSTGFEACKPINFSKYGGDEILVGRAGFLSGIYWINQNINPPPFEDNHILEICDSIIESGRQYSNANQSIMPLMYQYHGTEYIGAAHGICAIYHMLLESPLFKKDIINNFPEKLMDIKNSIDKFVDLQDQDGNFPVAFDDIYKGRSKEKRLVHWCHGAPGAIYLLVKSYIIFKEEKYLKSAIKAADVVWKQGLLFKGPGICHGISGNAYVFLIMYRLTNDKKYLYRALKFMEFLTNEEFLSKARTPDRPFSLYEGIAGTVCFLIDLLQPSKASFPFMEVFE